MLNGYSYNSAVYSSVYAADFAIFMATEDMLSNNATTNYLGLSGSNSSATYYPSAKRLYASALSKNLTRLEVSDCVKAYSTTYQTTRGNLILVVSNSTFNRTPRSYDNNGNCARDPVGWICGTNNCYNDEGPPCSASQVDTTDWKPYGTKTEYCLSEVLEQRCKVQLTPNLAYIVCAFNLIKAVVLIYTFFLVKENPLMTIGDAIASFLRRKDYSTKNHCLMGKADVRDWTHPTGGVLSRPLPKSVNRQPKKWASVISRRRWISFISL
jgi:hypothetical protein